MKEIPSDGLYDVVLLMDILEHTSMPVQLLERCRDRLAPRGRLVITVPAFQWLWTAYDEIIHLKKQFNLLRIVDNDAYPAFFVWKGVTYTLRIEKKDNA